MRGAHERETRPADAFTIGYLQVGSAAHGICRYGRLLAEEGRHHPNVNILEENIQLDGDRARDRHRLEVAASRLSAADVVHVQVSLWSAGSWGAGSRAMRNLRTFHRACRARIVCTLHDVTALISLENQMPLGVLRTVIVEMGKGLLRPLVHRLRGVRRPVRAAAPRTAWRNLGGYRAWRLVRWLAGESMVTFVLTTAEERLLASMALSRKTALIPHFVEDPPLPTSSARPRRQRKVVILAGFIFDAKGHRMMVEAMPLLPDIEVTFVGGSASPRTAPLDWLTRLAGELGVLDRLQITGYLPEAEYQGHLMKADLAVCPFGPRKGASGSLSSLIAAGCPVVASDIPLIREYNDLVPGAIATFSPYTADALAGAVRVLLDRPRSETAAGLEELRRRLSIHAIYDRHLDHYGRAAREARRHA